MGKRVRLDIDELSDTAYFAIIEEFHKQTGMYCTIDELEVTGFVVKEKEDICLCQYCKERRAKDDE
jgi:hypothetical protein